jgi:DNA-binding transcriptional MerR regulator
MEEELTIQEVAAQTGLSVHTLRYYERVGLLDPVGRASSGHRRYMADDIAWISFLQCLRKTGMSIRQMQAYADLRRRGDASIPERLAFLEEHQRLMQENMHQLEAYMDAIKRKIQHNRSMLADENKNTDQVSVSSRLSFAMPSKEEEIVSSS